MRTVADVSTVSTDDLVNSLLNSVTSTTSSPSTSSTTSPPSTSTTTNDSASAPASASTSHSAASSSPSSSPSSASSSDAQAPNPFTEAPAAETETPAPESQTSEGSNSETNAGGAASASTDGGDDGNGAALSIGIAVGVLAPVVVTLLFLRSRRKRANKRLDESTWSPPAGATCLTVPADRGFKQEHELGMPEMSIELAPNQLGLSKGLDISYASSRSSANSNNQYNASVASSSDGSVFNTQGGVSPTSSNRKMASYSYQYRESEEGGGAKSNSSNTFHLTGLIGNGSTASGRGAATPKRGPGGRKLSAPDEYAELATTTNAQPKVDMNALDRTPQVMHADFRQSSNMNISMGPDAADNQSFLAPLPAVASKARPTQTRAPSDVRASEMSMGPDSPVARGKRTGSVYDTIPNLTGEKMAASYRSSEDPREMSTASFLSESSISSTSTRDSVATSARSSAYAPSMPLLQQLSSAEDSDYGDDLSSDRSSDSANARPGSLIALNLEAKDGCSEIAI
ncbi:hypothetical protein PF001_g1578 [Phytophthora fragariae]|uniref:Uncharacterized protein n=1 Tax=Phytophthora fragariae TaxID=53985 RepID=A0A6A4ELB3_9STRA|nr:hypothetical protein PF001_g1578 [Phytophthora fragariae]